MQGVIKHEAAAPSRSLNYNWISQRGNLSSLWERKRYSDLIIGLGSCGGESLALRRFRVFRLQFRRNRLDWHRL
jgi:hypothetical protein